MRITKKVRNYNEFIDDIQERALDAAEQWTNYAHLIGETYLEHRSKFPMGEYIYDMREQLKHIHDRVTEGLGILEKRYCREEIEQGFEGVGTNDIASETDDESPF